MARSEPYTEANAERSATAFACPSAAELARWAQLPALQVIIARLWGGEVAPLPPPKLELSFSSDALEVRVDAPFHGDPKPEAEPGSVPGLWEHEVVELFLLGRDELYLELELGPHGHYLALRLDGVRQVQAQGMTLPYRAEIAGDRWSGRARVPGSWLPPGLCRFNAYAIDGSGAGRRYWALYPGTGQPDFHRLDLFGPFPPPV